MSEGNKDVTITDINISMGTVFRLVLQFTIAPAVIVGVIGFIYYGLPWIFFSIFY